METSNVYGCFLSSGIKPTILGMSVACLVVLNGLIDILSQNDIIVIIYEKKRYQYRCNSFHSRTTSMSEKLFWNNFNFVMLFRLFYSKQFRCPYVWKNDIKIVSDIFCIGLNSKTINFYWNDFNDSKFVLEWFFISWYVQCHYFWKNELNVVMWKWCDGNPIN